MIIKNRLENVATLTSSLNSITSRSNNLLNENNMLQEKSEKLKDHSSLQNRNKNIINKKKDQKKKNTINNMSKTRPSNDRDENRRTNICLTEKHLQNFTPQRRRVTNQKVKQRNFLIGDSHLQRLKKFVINNDDSKKQITYIKSFGGVNTKQLDNHVV